MTGSHSAQKIKKVQLWRRWSILRWFSRNKRSLINRKFTALSIAFLVCQKILTKLKSRLSKPFDSANICIWLRYKCKEVNWMELGNQIKKYRSELQLSQDQLAEHIYVSRQTISNWENEKSYPDVNSLVLLSEVFKTSIDNLIKGDIENMKEKICVK